MDWVYPPVCGGCGRKGARWCAECRSRVVPIAPPLCDLCGWRLDRYGDCAFCRHSHLRLDGARSWAYFQDPLKNAIHRLKYRGDISLGEALSEPLPAVLRQAGWSVDLITPIPLNLARQAERGYNQAALLAQPLALAVSIPYRPGAIKKIRATPSQVGLSRTERRENLRDVFRADEKLVSGKRILLVDDIMTTGATLSACAKSLYAAGALGVYGLTLARADVPIDGSEIF